MGPLSEDWHPYKERRDFPGGPVARTVPSNAGGAGLIPRWGTQISHASCRIPPPKKKQQKSYCFPSTEEVLAGQNKLPDIPVSLEGNTDRNHIVTNSVKT